MIYLLIPVIICFVVWLIWGNGIDKLKHPIEWKDKGSSGEQTYYLTLIKKFKIPEETILRNVYVPTSSGGTSEIDILIVCSKGLLVLECKNYAGTVYGDAKMRRWIQYVGNKKSYFYNPFFQNRSHVEHLRTFLRRFGHLPIIPMVGTISDGKWKVRNLAPDDYLLGYNIHLSEILARTPDSATMIEYGDKIIEVLRPLSRPDEQIKQQHIDEVNQYK